MSDVAVDYDAANEDEETQTTDEQGSQSGEGEARDVGGVGGERLRSFIDRIMRLEEEKANLSEDIKEVYGEAKGVGFEPKIIRKIIRIQKMDNEKRREEEDLLDLYMTAIGMK